MHNAEAPARRWAPGGHWRLRVAEILGQREAARVPAEPPIASSSCAGVHDEYWYHVAPQHDMPLAGAAREPLLLSRLDVIYPAGSVYRAGTLDIDAVANWIYNDPDLVSELRLVLSISDKRFYLDLSYLCSRTRVPDMGDKTVCGCLPNTMKKHSTNALIGYVKRGSEARRRRAAWVIAEYLAGRGLIGVLDLYFGLSREQRIAINDLWLSPHNVQQNETKRRGHGAEAEIAQALLDAGAVVYPPNKATDPMGAADPNISLQTFEIVPRVAGETVSVDVAVLGKSGELKIMVMGLVQSSDPGQFGVDKAATNGRIRERLENYRRRTGSELEMWGIVDGIGYAENPNGTVYPMLRQFDYFVQHNSAYKAVLGAGRLGLATPVAISYDMAFYTEQTRDQMHGRYGSGVIMIERKEDAPIGTRPVAAGRATVWLAD
jgi:hypothetical protein